MFALNDTILLQGARTSGLVNNSTIIKKITKRGLDKFKSVINNKNFWRSEILSNNFHDEVGDCKDNLTAIVEKANPTHMSVAVMTWNREGMRGAPNITMKKIKRCRGRMSSRKELEDQ